MVIVREVFIAKPGQASKLAKLFKEAWANARIMTDMTGVYNKVVVETEYDSMSHFESEMQKYMENKGDQKPVPGYTDMYSQGKREIYRVW